MSHDHPARNFNADENNVLVREKIIGAVSPLEQLDTLRRASQNLPSFLQAPINYEAATEMLADIGNWELRDDRLLSLFVRHRTQVSTEEYNWKLLQNGHPSFPGNQPQTPLSQSEYWSREDRDSFLRYTPGLYILEFAFYDVSGKSVDQLRGEHEHLAGVEALPAVALQKYRFAQLDLGDVVIGGIRKNEGEDTKVAPVLRINEHNEHKVDAVYTDSKLGKGSVPVVAAKCLMQEFQW